MAKACYGTGETLLRRIKDLDYKCSPRKEEVLKRESDEGIIPLTSRTA